MIIYQPKATRPSFHTFLFGCNVSPPVSASTGFTPSGTDPQVYTCYDSYATPSTWGTAYNYNQVFTDHIQTNNVKGLVTGVKAKVLGTTTWVYTVNYYDKYGKLIQSHQSNPEGGYNRTSMAYNFTGQPIKQQVYHKKTSTSTPITTEERYTYDHMGRPLTSTHSYNGWNFFTIAQNTYDELGRMAKKELHNGFQDIDYQYNIRGWLTRINDPITIGGNKLFAMELFYDTDMSAALSGGPQFNGNINGIKWRNYNNGLLTWKGYNFTYDGLNRLKQGDYGTYTTGWNNTNTYDLSGVTYDMNGNISTMNCKNPAGTDKENLAYSYTGNQLTSVTSTYNSVTNKTGSFTYDANGNAISDGLRGLASVAYFDEMDLPKQYFKDANNKVDYQYDAMGNKWGKTATISGTPSTMNYYGQFIYQGNTLSKVLTPEGFFDPVTYMYHYHLKDHLGNTRVTFYYSGSTPVVDQEVEYYPFGAMFAQNNLDKNTHLYNGKELNNEFFENYDFGWRFYDPELGRWHTSDLLAEKYYDWSPYNYVGNNPIHRLDLFGLDWYTDKDGTYQYDPKINKDSKLADGQAYVGQTYEVKDRNGNLTTSYRKDGSIMFSHEKDAYNRMWDQANGHYNKEKEVGGFTLEDGRILVTPDYDNKKDDCTPTKYGYTASKDGYLSKEEEKLKITGNIHTHQDPSGNASPSYISKDGGWGDIGFSKTMGGLPIMTIGYDGKIYGDYWSNKGNGYAPIQGLGNRKDLLIGKTQLILWLKTYPVKGR